MELDERLRTINQTLFRWQIREGEAGEKKDELCLIHNVIYSIGESCHKCREEYQRGISNG